MNFFESLFLGLVQGFTEWLPISSTGHLVILQNFFKINTSAEFDIAIMLGTTLALIIYFRTKLFSLLKDLLKLKKESLDYLTLLLISGLVSAAIGFPLKDFFKSFFYSPILVCIFFLLNGLLIFLASKKSSFSSTLNPAIAFAVGLAQSISLLPGISRSGSTISIALILGVDKIKAAEFSFLLGIPSMLVASLVEFNYLNNFMQLDLILIGIISAFIAGYVSIEFFFKILKEGKFVYFAYYSFIIGMLFLIYFSFFG
ncbi:MAG: undecaprenyl-diphosphate phosphatase [Candidatus Micrarchaeota archaeon]|nr:undecaprenyl-diphosphate phosphatase [Candidatus Micrarchaeota archaeon]